MTRVSTDTDTRASFRAPNFSARVDLDAHLALMPAGAAVAGQLFRQMINEAPDGNALLARAGVTPQTYFPFLRYSHHDGVKITYHAAQMRHPTLPTGEALRQLGRTVYTPFFETRVGRGLFRALGRNAESVIERLPQAYGLVLNYGKLRCERVAPGHLQYVFEGLPIFIETYQVGIIEGVLARYQASAEIGVAVTDLANVSVSIRFDSTGTQR